MTNRSGGQHGQVLALTALLTPVLVAFAGLCIDGGEIAAQARWSQNAADAAALAAAYDITNNGFSLVDATNLGNLLAGENNIPAADLTLSYYQADGTSTASTPAQVAFVQADVSHTFPNLFLPIINIDTASVAAHARVAVASGGGCGLCVMSSNASPAVQITGTSSIHLNSAININSNAAGATSTTASVYIHSGSMTTTAGGINLVGTALVNGGGSVNPAATLGSSPITDPLAAVPALDPSLCGTTYTQYGAWDSGNSGASTIPGGAAGAVACYPSISIHGSATVTMTPGRYVISGPMTVSNGGSLAANGVFIYLSCNSGAGFPASPIACPGTGQVGGSITISGSAPVTITAQNSGTYQGLAIMADRQLTNANTTVLSMGGSGTLSTTGTVYALSGHLDMSGSAASQTFSSRFIVGTVTESGSSSININYTASQNYATPGSLKLVL
jgi:putative Flp pilus-assembly TadE/G-like protein